MHPSITTLASFGLLSSAVLGASGDELDPLIGKLNSNNIREKAEAVRTLGEIGPAATESVTSLLELVKADDPGLSYESIIALGRINSEASRVIPALCNVLSNKPPMLKLAAIDSLQKFGPTAGDALPLLKELLENDVPILRIAAARAIAEIGIGQQFEIDAVIPILISGLQSSQRGIATDAIHGLAVIGEPVIAAILDLFDSSDVQTVCNACDALAAIGSTNANVIAKLVALTKSENHSLRWHAINALGEVGSRSKSIIPILIAGLQDPDSHVRFSAEQALHKMGRPALPALIESLSDEKLQRTVAAIIGGMGSAAEAAIEPLSRLLHSRDPGTRRDAIFALAEMGSNAEAVVPELIEALQDKQFPFPSAAAYALGRLRSKDAIEALKGSLKERKEPLISLATACALIEIDPEDAENTRVAIPYLTAALKHERPEIRREAARALGRLGKGAINVAADLQKGLNDKDPDVQRECLDALAEVETVNPPVIADIIKALNHGNSDLRSSACYALGRIGEPANIAIPSLNKLLESHDPHEKTVAAWALVHIATDPDIKKVTLPVLIAALHGDRNPHVRRQVAETLGEIGQDSPLTKEALQVALRDPDEAVREAANKAITSLK